MHRFPPNLTNAAKVWNYERLGLFLFEKINQTPNIPSEHLTDGSLFVTNTLFLSTFLRIPNLLVLARNGHIFVIK